jgi:hypothetical protein
MKTLYLNLLVILTFLSSCKSNKRAPTNSLFVQSDVGEVTTLAFNAAMPSDTTVKRGLPMFFRTDDPKKREDYKNRLDTTLLTVLIADTLIRLPSIYLKREFDAYKPDDNIKNWASEIIIDETPALFQMKNTRFDRNYLYKLLSSYKKTDDDNYIAGLFKMSNVFFNKNKTKAFVYAERRGGTVLAVTHDFYFEKKDGIWLLIKDGLSVE